MNRFSRLTLVALLATLLLTPAPGLCAAEPQGDGDETGSCCFTNTRFNGVCQVTPAGGETCGSILAYLNNPNGVGKNYCGNTQVRGGWTQVDCTQQSARASSAPACDPPNTLDLAGDRTL